MCVEGSSAPSGHVTGQAKFTVGDLGKSTQEKTLRTTTSIYIIVNHRKCVRSAPRRDRALPRVPVPRPGVAGGNEKQLHDEVLALRKEVKELREVVNVLLEMVMEQGDTEEFEAVRTDLRPDKNNRLPMGM